ncbi:MAG: 8-oxo-dGTP diphosphatase MutT [Pseudohongiellaceae bacterium]
MSHKSLIHVAVGVLVNDARQVLVARRHAHSHQGGLWEFPGGKLEVNETPEQGLRREFLEEVGIQIHQAYPLRKISHDYGDKSVLLDVWRIHGFDGEPRGLEGQPVEWRPVAQLSAPDFPVANAPILDVQLPETWPLRAGADWSQVDAEVLSSAASA